MCSIDGTISLVLVPHIYRQELYTEELQEGSMYFDKRMQVQDQRNVASVNFFVPKLEKYPYFENVQKFNVNLKTGDCVFIPAYFFYQMQGNNQNIKPGMFANLTKSILDKEGMEDYKKDQKMATAVSLRYQGNSQLLAGFYDAIENKVIS